MKSHGQGKKFLHKEADEYNLYNLLYKTQQDKLCP